MDKQTLRGLATISFYAADHEGAKKWYSEFLGVDPYFSVPGYVEFRIGDYLEIPRKVTTVFRFKVTS